MRTRRALAEDIEAVITLPPDPATPGVGAERLRVEFAEHRMRPEWTWIIEDDHGALVGRALWWGRYDSDTPVTLDDLQVLSQVQDRAAIAAVLLRQAHREFAALGAPHPPEYQIRLGQDWLLDPTTVRAVNWRRTAASAAGLSEQLERLRYEWTPEAGIPPASTRLVFREGDDAEFLVLFEQAARGTLDITSKRALASMGPQAQAKDDLDFYLDCPGKRSWWRIAAHDGQPVGFIIPSATPYHRNVGYLGVLPQHRGRGHASELLAEVTRIHALEDAERITATTDTSNYPMVSAFDRAGYHVTEVRLILEQPAVDRST